jgi:hypothetical protein
MFVGTGIDQLRVYPHLSARTLNTSFQHMCDSKLLPNLPQVSGGTRFTISSFE